MNKIKVIKLVSKVVEEKFKGEATGHDYWHMVRVRDLALKIGKVEKCDLFIVELGALLHDIADFKFVSGGDAVAPHIAREILSKAGADEPTIVHIAKLITEVSFKGAGTKTIPSSKEGAAVQDADRLDALGAIGIARCFAYGGSKHRPIYDPKIKPGNHKTFEQYKNSNGTSLNHFYEKLLLVKDRMHTKTGKNIAKDRHAFLQNFLKQFHAEWEGKK